MWEDVTPFSTQPGSSNFAALRWGFVHGANPKASVVSVWRNTGEALGETKLFCFFWMEELYFCSWENGPMVHIFLQLFLGSVGEKTIVSSATTATLNISWWISCRWLTAMARPYFMWLHERVVFRWSRRHQLEWSCIVLKLEKNFLKWNKHVSNFFCNKISWVICLHGSSLLSWHPAVSCCLKKGPRPSIRGCECLRLSANSATFCDAAMLVSLGRGWFPASLRCWLDPLARGKLHGTAGGSIGSLELDSNLVESQK